MKLPMQTLLIIIFFCDPEGVRPASFTTPPGDAPTLHRVLH